ncbi:LexA family protein, partial [Ralstonia pseudosolanacearum]
RLPGFRMNQKSLPLSGERSACTSFTDKQGQYLAFIWAYSLINGRAPAERDMQRFSGTTPPSVHQMVLNLERDGLLRRQAGIARSIELLVDHNCLPVLQPTQTVITSVLRY